MSRSQIHRPTSRRIPFLTLAVAALVGPAAAQHVVDFEGIPAGTIVSELPTLLGGGPVLVNAQNPNLPDPNVAVVFDSSAPTGGDLDLGTPHQDFGGPGVGAGGAQGSPYQNDTPLGNILIVAEDMTTGPNGLVMDPDDAAVAGSTMTFDFVNVGEIRAQSISLIDFETDRASTVELFTLDGVLIGYFPVPATGDNGVITIGLNDTGTVGSILVTFGGSGAVTGLEFEPDCSGGIGYQIWKDLDADGIQDGSEPGIPGVRVVLEDSAGNELAETLSDDLGKYYFSDVCAGTYQVRVDESTLPDGMAPSPCMVGDDPTVDSDCSPALVTLSENDQVRLDVDFGYVCVPFVYCESEPNSTGQTAGVAGSGDPSISANDFTLIFQDAPPSQPGFVFFGTSQEATPFGNGVRCIGDPVVRLRKTTIDAVGGSEVQLDFTMTPLDQIQPSVPYYFQLWFRDPLGGPPGFNTSDALCVTFTL